MAHIKKLYHVSTTNTFQIAGKDSIDNITYTLNVVPLPDRVIDVTTSNSEIMIALLIDSASTNVRLYKRFNN